MAIFNSYVKLPEGKTLMELHGTNRFFNSMDSMGENYGHPQGLLRASSNSGKVSACLAWSMEALPLIQPVKQHVGFQCHKRPTVTHQKWMRLKPYRGLPH